MRHTAQWAIEEKRRRRNDLSDAAEDHCDRLRRSLYGGLSTAQPAVVPQPHRGAFDPPALQHSLSSSTTSTSLSLYLSASQPSDLTVLLIEELHQRASLQLAEAMSFASSILQPFASASVVLALRYEMDRDEAAHLHQIMANGVRAL